MLRLLLARLFRDEWQAEVLVARAAALTVEELLLLARQAGLVVPGLAPDQKHACRAPVPAPLQRGQLFSQHLRQRSVFATLALRSEPNRQRQTVWKLCADGGSPRWAFRPRAIAQIAKISRELEKAKPDKGSWFATDQTRIQQQPTALKRPLSPGRLHSSECTLAFLLLPETFRYASDAFNPLATAWANFS
jgi:hypothetical protein